MKNTKGRRCSTEKKKISAKKIALSVIGLLFLFVTMGTTYVFSQIKPPEIPRIEESDNLGEYNEEDVRVGGGPVAPEGVTNDDRKEYFFTFLIFGMDDGVNTDTIMVASYDAVHKEANIISIPRDSLVNVERKVKKINGAYAAGTLNGGGRLGGVEQFKREIKTIIGFVPHYYIAIDLTAFVKIIDATHGVEIDVPFDMKYTDPRQGLTINIPKGKQTLSGEQAIHFARYRLGDKGYRTISDYQRIKNQQAVIKALLERLLTPSIYVKNPMLISDIISIFSDHIFSDLDAGELGWFARELNSIRGTDALNTYTMPTNGGSGFPMYYEYLDKAAIIELVNQTINPFRVDIKADDVNILSAAP